MGFKLCESLPRSYTNYFYDNDDGPMMDDGGRSGYVTTAGDDDGVYDDYMSRFPLPPLPPPGEHRKEQWTDCDLLLVDS